MPTHLLTLYVSGDAPGNRRLAVATRDWCDRHCGGRYRLEVFDILQWPERAAAAQVLVTPLLVAAGLPVRVVGDLSDVPRAMAALGVAAG
jgi:circadian clock protein KaiB